MSRLGSCVVALLAVDHVWGFLGSPPRIQQCRGARETGRWRSAASVDQESDPYERALEQEMLSIVTPWARNGTSGSSEHVRINPDAPVVSERFSAWSEVVTLPRMYSVYYGGEHDGFFWKQSRETVHVYMPVDPEVAKSEVSFEMVTKTRVRLSIRDKLVLDRELAYPVFKGNSFWYFESSEDGQKKVVVLELDKRLAYSNWPKLFPEDPDPSRPPQKPLTEEQQAAMAALQAAGMMGAA